MVNFHIYFLQNVNAVDVLGPLFKNKMKTIKQDHCRLCVPRESQTESDRVFLLEAGHEVRVGHGDGV